jgi:hypothetical protein
MATRTRHDLTPVRVPIAELIHHPENARKHDLSILKASLTAHGQYITLVRQRSTGFVVKGNGTMDAAKQLRWKDLDVVTLDLTDDQARRILLIDNKSSDHGDYEAESLAALLAALEGDLAGTGYTEGELEALMAALAPSTDPYDTGSTGDLLSIQDVSLGEPNHQTHRGDVWQLGPVEHSLLATEDKKDATSVAGPHVLVVTTVAKGWPMFVPHLEPDVLLLPYPGPYMAVTKLGMSYRCVFVQPDLYLAGHLLDKWEAVFPGTTSKLSHE